MNSKDYWAKREEEQRKKNITDEKEYAKKIQEIYGYTLDQVEKEINGFYTKYAKAEGITMAEAKKRVSQMDIDEYSRKAKKYVESKDFSKKANEEMRLYNATMKINRLEMLKANIGLEMVSGFDELDKFFGEKLTDRSIEEFKRQAGILGKTVTNNAKMAESIVNASFHNATYSDRIWMYQSQMKAELSKLLQEGLVQGKHPRELARHLDKLFGVGRANAERLMITEMARVQTESQKKSFEKNGFEEYEFIAESKACPICAALNGKHFKVSKMMPGENAAPMHPYCRCSVAAWEDGDDYEAWLDFLDKGGTTEEWEKYGKTLLKQKGKPDNKKVYTNTNLLGKHMHLKTAKMSSDEYVKAKEMWNQFKEINISQREKEHIYEELDNNLTAEEKENALVNKAIGDYYYYAVNKGHNQYKIYKRVPLEPYDDIVDEVLSEMFGRDWKKQWKEIEKLKKNL